jgi:hypothetical protein
MAETPNPVHTNPRLPYKDSDGNEIGTWGKFIAGVIIIFFTVFSGLYLIAHWPDRIPGPKENSTSLYTYQWFQVRLVDMVKDTNSTSRHKAPLFDTAKTMDTINAATDSGVSAINTPVAADPLPVPQGNVYYVGSKTPLVHINTLLLILVAIAGFLGNMIHLSTSFTTFVGAGKFRKSWLLWYIVKPFTAAALAIAIYFVFRGGFLNMSDDSANINLYGLMTISLMSGLFTDRATLKLKELFDVLLRTSPKEERPDQLTNGGLTIKGITAAPLEAGKPATIILNGEKMNEGQIDITIEDQPVTDMNRVPERISFTYTLPESLKDRESVMLIIKTEHASMAESYPLQIKASSTE